MKDALNAKLYDEFYQVVFPYTGTEQDYTPYYITCIKISEDETYNTSSSGALSEQWCDVLIKKRNNTWSKTKMKKKLIWNMQEEKYNKVPAIIDLNDSFDELDLKKKE